MQIIMGTDVVKSYDTLERELEKARSNLKGLNDNIRRIIGRDPQEANLRGDRKRSFNENRRGDFNNVPRNRERELSPIPNKRRSQQEAKSVFSRLSGPVRDEEVKPKIHSRVIRELPTRQEIVAAQGVDEQSRARNRRMFGCLLGTLQKFCQEESRLKEKEDMKAQIEKKLEEQQIQERENLKRERQTLFSDRKRQQLNIRMLELKMNRLREFEVWEKSKRDLYNFIRTKSKPPIYYRPKKMNSATEKKLAQCRSDLEQEIEKKRTIINEDILAIEGRFRLREEYGKEARNETTKHDRRNENDEEDDDQDSMYENSDEDNQIHAQNEKEVIEDKAKIEEVQVKDENNKKTTTLEDTTEEKPAGE